MLESRHPPEGLEPPLATRLFKVRPTREARERLESIDSKLHELEHYGLATQRDQLAAVDAKRELARWYARALARAQLSLLLGSARQRLRERREHERVHDRARAEAVAKGRSPASQGAGGSAASTDSSDDSDSSTSFRELLTGFITDTSQFFERLTNGGVSTGRDRLGSRLRLDLPSALIHADVAVPTLDLGFNFRLRPGDKPMPFSGGGGNADDERLVLWGAHTLPWLGVSGSVRYEVGHRALGAAVTRQVVGPLWAQVARSWSFKSGGSMASSAAISMAFAF
jgi:hypothetical protein